MKPWNNPAFQVNCVNCGASGWNLNASWLDTYVCSQGCDPERVRSYQRKLLEQERREASANTNKGA